MHVLELRFFAELKGQRIDLPPFLGATLRGALGFLLKEAVCQVKQTPCEACFLKNVCPYVSVFEGLAPEGRKILKKYPNIPQPFVLVLPSALNTNSAPNHLEWGVRLFGSATRNWPYVVNAFRTIGERGLGSRKVKYQLTCIRDGHSGKNVWDPDFDMWNEPEIRVLPDFSPSPLASEESVVKWTFHTPVNIKTKGELSGIDIVLNGTRRQKLIQNFYGNNEVFLTDREFIDSEKFKTVNANLRPFRLNRYSGRQQQQMSLHGLVGEITIAGPWAATGSWIHQIPVLHLGKSTSFGFGKVTWEVVGKNE